MALIDTMDMKKNLSSGKELQDSFHSVYGDPSSLSTSNTLEHLTLSASNISEVDKIEKYHWVYENFQAQVTRLSTWSKGDTGRENL